MLSSFLCPACSRPLALTCHEATIEESSRAPILSCFCPHCHSYEGAREGAGTYLMSPLDDIPEELDEEPSWMCRRIPFAQVHA
jgi:hypothetical protein